MVRLKTVRGGVEQRLPRPARGSVVLLQQKYPFPLEKRYKHTAVPPLISPNAVAPRAGIRQELAPCVRLVRTPVAGLHRASPSATLDKSLHFVASTMSTRFLGVTLGKL